MSRTHVDVLVVGAGISGIGAGYYLKTRCPDLTYAIVESRGNIGGTWDLFRYPGIRSDSDMFTLGYAFRPWTGEKSIADGGSILRYVRETADEHGITEHIRFHHRVVRAEWSSQTSRWHVTAERTDEKQRVELSCSFLFMCSGYYDYEQGHSPAFPGIERFSGRVVHPQHWTDDIDYAGKRVVVIGSGATAVTLVPELAKRAEHVSMLQRSPSYIISVPAVDPIARWMARKLPARASYAATRWKNVLLTAALFSMSRRAPRQVKSLIKKAQRKALGPDYDLDTHFSPRYDPWDQRMCLVPDGDLFEAINDGRASIATDEIETFTETGIRLRSGSDLPADLVVTATGLKLLFLGGIEFEVDGERLDAARALTYKGMMLSDVPNLALCFGYTNASWTLKVDLTCEYVCRLLRLMRARGYTRCVPRRNDPEVRELPFLDFSSGYVQRALPTLPRQGSKAPWRLYQNYFLDILAIRHGPLEDSVMEFS